ncbi:hypothetical protein E2C01_014355 [Portunus trituberculatus]|uniref:Uncharacterized protein n=1 Tax=Portunus trituberculatus TaxID=210409 RepID=A0A5B7DJR5_PORTR|nr:hypothetical protein [Portunus trituberculatus]
MTEQEASLLTSEYSHTTEGSLISLLVCAGVVVVVVVVTEWACVQSRRRATDPKPYQQATLELIGVFNGYDSAGTLTP